MSPLTLRNVEIGGRPGLSVRIEGGRIAAIGPGLPAGGEDIDGGGGALIPGLCDHHVHIFGLAARAASVNVEGLVGAEAFRRAITDAAARQPEGSWIRVLGYHESIAGELSRETLDRLAPRHRVRVQHQTGSLWILNSFGMAALPSGEDPPGLERDAGRVWRGDVWLRTHLGSDPPALAPLGRRLAALGVTALTDASVTTDQASADALAQAHRSGDLPQRLMLMSGGALTAPADRAFTVGPLKVLLDEHALPDLEDLTGRIRRARTWNRAVAVHCVTATELALTLAAFEAEGAQDGDRIEHGGVIPKSAIPQIRALGLVVVTQPAFVQERGDRYLADVDPEEQDDLYRCASLLEAGIAVAGSSDAPYASPDPWAGIAAATTRRTERGHILGFEERVDVATALNLYLDEPGRPGRRRRRLAVGATADLCLLRTPLREALDRPHAANVRATLIAGRLVHGPG